MKNLIILLSVAIVALSSCSKDSALEKTDNPIMGVWNYDAIEYDVKVNNQNIYTYLDSIGIPPENIALFSFLIESEIMSELEGLVVKFNADNSYEILRENEIENSGTYDLNLNKNELNLTDSNNENIALKIVTLNETSLIATGDESIDAPEEINIFDASLNIIFQVSFIK
jgi:hypothetical protein